MYYIKKKFEVAGAHKLDLSYESKCKSIHGHNWWVTVYVRGEHLNQNGMLIDFKRIKTLISDQLDHKYINDVIPEINPTAENIAKWICDEINIDLSYKKKGAATVGTKTECYKVKVEESNNNTAIYEID